MSTPSMVRFLDVIFYPLEALVSLFAYLFWMICWAVWQVVLVLKWMATRIVTWVR